MVTPPGLVDPERDGTSPAGPRVSTLTPTEPMFYLDFLESLHRQLAPRTYLEIGVRRGASLSLSRCPSIGVDPDYELAVELGSDTVLERSTSDDYFAGLSDRGPFDGAPIDLAFVDGLHLAEFALRDLLNVERLSAWSTVIVVDDIYPRQVEEAARQRHTEVWTGDVFKVPGFLERHCPDLVLVRVDTEPTGLLLVFCPDPGRRLGPVLQRLPTVVTPDPPEVPDAILTRRGARAPEALLASPVWAHLAAERAVLSPEAGRALVLSSLGFV